MPGVNPRLAPQIIKVGSAITANGTIPAFVAPVTSEIVAVYARVQTALAGNTTNYMSIAVQNGGTTGTGTAAVVSRGGKSTQWEALQKYTLLAETSNPKRVARGACINIAYTEAGTVAVGDWEVVFHVVPGTAI